MAKAPRIIPTLPPQEIERFWSLVDKSAGIDACWPWNGPFYSNGYGLFYIRSFGLPKIGQFHAHRIALFLVTGQQPPVALHRCDNPPCCNPHPWHVEAGDQLMNIRDMLAKGRNRYGIHPSIAGDLHPLAKVTSKQVIAIRTEYAHGQISQSALARKYGITQTTVHAIITGKHWTTAGGPIITAIAFRRHPRPDTRKFSDAMIEAVRLAPEPSRVVARQFGMSKSYVNLVRARMRTN